MPKFVVIDLETTSIDPKAAHVVEWAAIEIPPPWFGQDDLPTMHTYLVRPPTPIPPETSAIHHIIDADVVHSPAWETVQVHVRELLDVDTIAVAHSVAYERTVLAPLQLPCRWLCTYKAALRVWPDCPSHSNECLRYWLGFGTGRKAVQQPHSALHDARVTYEILLRLMQQASVLDMIQWTDEPALLPRCPIGTWRGSKWEEVEDSFLWWIVRKVNDPDDRSESIRFCAQRELNRREEAERTPLAPAPSPDAPF